jgi:two-component system response regulator NreC
MSRIRVLLAEDHEIVRHGLRLLIDAQSDMEVIDEVGNGRFAIRHAHMLKPDVVVMDLFMPEMNGLAATRSLKTSQPGIAVVALTRHTDDAYVHELMNAGASAYVLKQSTSTELLRAIRAAAAGNRYVDTSIAARMAGNDAAASRRHPATPPSVSDRENQVLRMMARGHSNKEIAATMGISVKTVEVHKANAMRKLGLRGRIDVVRYAVLQGWLREQ